MKKKYLYILALTTLTIAGLSSCSKDDDGGDPIPSYEVPTTYSFEGADYNSSTIRIKQMSELDAYVRSSHSGTILDATKATDMFNNTNNPFTEASLNSSGINLAEKTADAQFFKGFIDDLVEYSKQALAVEAEDGKAGYVVRGSGKILVNEQGIENVQAISKGLMGAIFFKEAMALLSTVKTDASVELQQQHWDEAFGYLAVPQDFDPTITYDRQLVFPEKPAYWGGYLAERGKNIDAGKIIFDAFLKGRAAIGAKDIKVRDEQITIIQGIWEKLAANAAYNYVYSPTIAANAGNLGTQFHALSEAYGFIASFKYRPAGSKLSDADFAKLQEIIGTNFYTLVNEAGYSKLKEAQDILKDTYGLPSLN